MTTTLSPNDIVQFYMIFPENSPFNREELPITFTLPSGKAFPSDLSGIMNKTKRFFSFDQSEVKGVSNPECQGTDCICQNCPSSTVLCTGIECKDYSNTLSTTGITCNKSTCTTVNEIKYSMYPLYPVDMTLSQYSPKFKFIKSISSSLLSLSELQKNVDLVKKLFVDETTIPPLENLQLPNFVMFSVVYPIDVFNTQAKYTELFDIISYTNIFTTLLKEERFFQHNIASLQKVVKKNNLQRDTLSNMKQGKQEFKKEDKKEGGVVSTDKPKPIQKVIPLKKPEISTPKPLFLQQNIPSIRPLSQQIFPSNPPTSTKPIMEKYEGEIALNNLVVPITKRDDTSLSADTLLTPEPDEIFIERPTPKINLLRIFLIICFTIVIVGFITYKLMTLYRYLSGSEKSSIQRTKRSYKR